MAKNLRNRKHVPIIEVSDSDCDINELTSDDDYVPEKHKSVVGTSSKTLPQKTENFVEDIGTTNAPIKKASSRKKEKVHIDGNTVCTNDVNMKSQKIAGIKRKGKNNSDQQISNKRQKKLGNLFDEVLDVESVNIGISNIQKIKNEEICKSSLDFHNVECNEWTDAEYISEVNNIDTYIAENVVKLFDEDNTIPFIARYRKNMTGGMEPDKLRALKESYDQAKVVKQRASTIIKTIDKLGKWTPELHAAIKCTKSLVDLDHIYSLFKPSSKRTLAERARQLGLGSVSEAVLQGNSIPHLSVFIDKQKPDLDSEEKIKEGIIHIIADNIHKDKTIFDKLKILQKRTVIEIHTTQRNQIQNTMNKQHMEDDKKYETYYNFKATNKSIKPHQVLAINRGEAQKMLTVKFIISDGLEAAFKSFCLQHYKFAISASKFHSILIKESVEYAYKKMIKPLIIRRLRSELKEEAEAASIDVFVSNVKQLLLVPPVRGKVILGIDPGFYHGCKLAVVSEQGNVLDSAVIYPHKKRDKCIEESARTLIDLVNKHKVSLIALGNATACRETESFLANIIRRKGFGSTNISYTIVDESGSSVYSCGPEAKSEFPNIDPNIISAISIARRLQDPLAELVKVEPKHLGVGMYQHDLPEKQLHLSLNEVVSEAVSFVGVDVNTASHCLLKRVAGLNVTRAANIIEWRNKHGSFLNRNQLLEVKGIGNKTFEQCAGFIRILSETALTCEHVANHKSSKKKNTSFNPLDQTWIHPESYKVAEKFIKHCKCNLDEIGSVSFIEKIKSHAKTGCSVLAKQFDTDETTMEIIIKGLTMHKNEDIRQKENAPLFRNSMLSIKDLDVGTVLSGAVRNVTHFGVFVDIGVGRDGLVHIKSMKNQTLGIGQRIEVKVQSIERDRGRISLELIRTL